MSLHSLLPSDRRGDGSLPEGLLLSHSPIDGSVIGVYRALSAAEVGEACARARRTGDLWRTRPWRERRQLLDRVRAVLLERADSLALAITREVGKPIVESYGSEVLPTLAALRDLPRRAERLFALNRRSRGWRPGAEAFQEYSPYGVIGIIGTWNYPLFLSLPVIAGALVAGNAVVWKPSELALNVANHITDLLRDAGVPPGLVQVVPGAAETGRALVEAACDKYVFIGGRETGREVLAALGGRLRPAVAELSGNDAMIVCDDAPLQPAVDGALWGRMLAAGQTCAAPRRIYVAAPLYPRFVERLRERVARLRMGDPRCPGTEVGPLRTERHVSECARLVVDARARGARLLAGGEDAPNTRGCFFAPTLLAEIPKESALESDDLFGPVLCVTPVADDDEAVRRAKGACSRRGDAIPALTASVWTRDRRRAADLAARLPGSLVLVNEVVLPVGDPALAFGGQRESGYGRLRGDAGLLEFVQTRTTVACGHRGVRHHYRSYHPAAVAVLRGVMLLVHGAPRQRLAGTRALMRAIRGYQGGKERLS